MFSALIKDGHDTYKIRVKHALSLASFTIVLAILVQNHNPGTYTALQGHSESNNPAHPCRWWWGGGGGGVEQWIQMTGSLQYTVYAAFFIDLFIFFFYFRS